MVEKTEEKNTLEIKLQNPKTKCLSHGTVRKSPDLAEISLVPTLQVRSCCLQDDNNQKLNRTGIVCKIADLVRLTTDKMKLRCHQWPLQCPLRSHRGWTVNARV